MPIIIVRRRNTPVTVPIYPPNFLPKSVPQTPTLTRYPAREGANTSGAAFVVCPGGGYSVLAEHEGAPVAAWLAGLGMDAYVLHYRVHESNRHPDMLDDARRAVRVVRQSGAAKVGILGFSAGGHLAATAATLFDAGVPDAPDPVEQQSSRPDCAVLIYPVITLRDPHAHAWSRSRLLGDDFSEQRVALLSPDEQVTQGTPPLFLVHSADDTGVPVHNSLLLASAASAAGVPFALHVFPSGGHGYGMGAAGTLESAWPLLCAAWLKQVGF